MRPKQPKKARIELRLAPETRRILERIAALAGLTASQVAAVMTATALYKHPKPRK